MLTELHNKNQSQEDETEENHISHNLNYGDHSPDRKA
jgi:hypothetical protein